MEHLRRTRDYLNALRAALIRRDMDELKQMQDHLSEEALQRQELDRSLESCRQCAAESLACRPEEVCISRLCNKADPQTAKRLRETQHQVQRLVREVKTAHLATELLLWECARINRRMLEAITGRLASAPVYDARGRTAWQPAAGWMNLKL
jgi:septin family protein